MIIKISKKKKKIQILKLKIKKRIVIKNEKRITLGGFLLLQSAVENDQLRNQFHFHYLFQQSGRHSMIIQLRKLLTCKI